MKSPLHMALGLLLGHAASTQTKVLNDIRVYSRDKKGNPTGLLIATPPITPSALKYHVGWAGCNKMDKFNKEQALKIALGRIEAAEKKNMVCVSTDKMPQRLLALTNRFMHRCERYFK